MSRAAHSVLVLGYYLLVLGAVVRVVVVPSALLEIYGIPVTQEIWIRVVGLLALDIGWYYVFAARYAAAPFFRLTV